MGLGLLSPTTSFLDSQVGIWWNMISSRLLAAAADGAKASMFLKWPNLHWEDSVPAL